MAMCKLKKWITDGSGKPFYTRKEIVLEQLPENALAYVCGLGQFNFYVNGRKVSDHVLDPAWTDYNKIVYYVKFDITEYLQKGKNVLAAEVGNGWYLADQQEGYFFHFPPFMPPNPNPYRPFGSELVFAVWAELKYENGDILTVGTDDSWKTAEHMIRHTNCFGSEAVDGRMRIPAWNGFITEGSEWKRAKYAVEGEKLSLLAREQTMPPVKVIRTYDGIYMKTVNGTAVYDFGQNVSGMLEFDIRGKTGQKIHVYPAEKLLQNGAVDQMAKNWLPVNVCETYVIASEKEWEHFEMTFTYFGGRYAAVDCDPENIRNIRLHAISSAYERAGEFWCDDERFMKIYDLIEKAVEANMVSVHTDCPTIERFAWQEENHLMAPAVMYMKKVKPHWEKFMTDLRLAQLTKDDWFHDMHHGKYYPGDGLVPAQAPCYIPNVLPVPGMGDFYNVIGWGSSIILGTNWHYQFYGDIQIIKDNYEAGKKYLNFLKTNMTEEGFISHGLGDWGNPSGEYAKANVETVFLYADATTMEKFALLLGKKQDAADFNVFAEQVKINYNDRLLVLNKKTGKYCYKIWDKDSEIVMTQAAQAMPLYWGMVPPEKEADVVESLHSILQADGSLKTGEVSQPYVIQTMCKYGMNDLLCDMILRPLHPSYYAFVVAGETTLGEYWEENPRSHCHDMLGHIAEWFYNGIAGIRPTVPGFSRVIIQPWLPKSVNHMKCTYRSQAGDIYVEVKRTGQGIEIKVEADDSIELTVDRSDLG